MNRLADGLVDFFSVPNVSYFRQINCAKPKNKNEDKAKPSNKPYKNNKEADRQARKQGYKDAHDLKKDVVKRMYPDMI